MGMWVWGIGGSFYSNLQTISHWVMKLKKEFEVLRKVDFEVNIAMTDGWNIKFTNLLPTLDFCILKGSMKNSVCNIGFIKACWWRDWEKLADAYKQSSFISVTTRVRIKSPKRWWLTEMLALSFSILEEEGCAFSSMVFWYLPFIVRLSSNLHISRSGPL